MQTAIVCTEVGEIKPEYEKCAYRGKLIFWPAPMKTFSRTRWGTVSKRTTYQKITIRNSTDTSNISLENVAEKIYLVLQTSQSDIL